MSTTITKLRAVVDATSVDEGAKKLREFGQTTSQVSSSSSQALGRVSSVLRGDFTGALVGLGATAGVITAGVAIAKVAVSMDDMRQRAANVRKELTAYAGSVTQAVEATEAMLRATDGGISRMDAMGAASKLLGMGLATNSQQVYDLSRMAVMLGDKTMTVTDRMASFNAMLANQSIERLDTFGISSGRVRARIEELQAAMPGLSREQAFVNAVLEIGAVKLKAVEAEGVTASTSVDKLTASWKDLTQAIAGNVSVGKGVDTGAALLGEFAMLFNLGSSDPTVKLAALNRQLADLKKQQADISAGKWVNQSGFDTAEAAAARLAAKVAEIEAQIRYLTSASAEYSDVGVAGFQRTADAADKAAAAVGRLAGAWWNSASARMYAEAMRPDTQRAAGYKGEADSWYNSANARAYAEAMRGDTQKDAATQYQERLERANKAAAQHTTTTIGDALEDAAREFETSLKGALQEGQQFSVGLFDLRPGGAQGPNTPGQNGAFEDIYRLQAFVQNGSWGETAQKYGLDKDSATQRIKDFQSGKWTPDVMQLIDKDKLTKQIQDAQLGKAMQEAVIADLAKTSGADARIVKAMLGMGGATDSKGAAAKLDLGGQLVPSLASAIDTELLSKGGELEKRGGVAWERLETGMIEKAKKSTKFVLMIEGMVDAALDAYVPPA